MKEKEVLTKWVRGHAGNPYNEKCDELAMAAAYAPVQEDIGYRDRKTVKRDADGTVGTAETRKPDTGSNAAQKEMPTWERIAAPGGVDFYSGPQRTV